MPTYSPRQVARSFSLIRCTSRPVTMISPSEGRSMPVIILSRVDLPLPDGPTIETNSPGFTCNEIPFRTVISVSPTGNRLTTSRTSTDRLSAVRSPAIRRLLHGRHGSETSRPQDAGPGAAGADVIQIRHRRLVLGLVHGLQRQVHVVVAAPIGSQAAHVCRCSADSSPMWRNSPLPTGPVRRAVRCESDTTVAGRSSR